MFIIDNSQPNKLNKTWKLATGCWIAIGGALSSVVEITWPCPDGGNAPDSLGVDARIVGLWNLGTNKNSYMIYFCHFEYYLINLVASVILG
jgi:hypothetical protein